MPSTRVLGAAKGPRGQTVTPQRNDDDVLGDTEGCPPLPAQRKRVSGGLGAARAHPVRARPRRMSSSSWDDGIFLIPRWHSAASRGNADPRRGSGSASSVGAAAPPSGATALPRLGDHPKRATRRNGVSQSCASAEAAPTPSRTYPELSTLLSGSIELPARDVSVRRAAREPQRGRTAPAHVVSTAL